MNTITNFVAALKEVDVELIPKVIEKLQELLDDLTNKPVCKPSKLRRWCDSEPWKSLYEKIIATATEGIETEKVQNISRKLIKAESIEYIISEMKKEGVRPVSIAECLATVGGLMDGIYLHEEDMLKNWRNQSGKISHPYVIERYVKETSIESLWTVKVGDNLDGNQFEYTARRQTTWEYFVVCDI